MEFQVKTWAITLIASLLLACGGGASHAPAAPKAPDAIPQIDLSIPPPVPSHKVFIASVPRQDGSTYQWTLLSSSTTASFVGTTQSWELQVMALDGGQEIHLRCEVTRAGTSVQQDIRIPIKRRWEIIQEMPFHPDEPQGVAQRPQIASDRQGMLHIAWVDGATLVTSSLQPEASVWAPPTPLETIRGSLGAGGLRWHKLMLDGSGLPKLIWGATQADGSTQLRYAEASTDPGGSGSALLNWTTQTLATDGGYFPARSLQSRSGNLHVFFSDPRTNWHQEHSAGGGWDPASSITLIGWPTYAEAAINDLYEDQNGLIQGVGWLDPDGIHSRVILTTLDAFGWNYQGNLDARGSLPNLRQGPPWTWMNPSGTKGWALWMEGDGDPQIERCALVAARWDGSHWLPPTELLQVGKSIWKMWHSSSDPLLVGQIQSDGSLKVLFNEGDRLAENLLLLESSGDAWNPPVRFTGPLPQLNRWVMQSGPSGELLALVDSHDPTSRKSQWISRYFDPTTGGWSEPEVVPAASVNDPMVMAPLPRGCFAAAWSQPTSSHSNAVLTAKYH